MLGVTFVVNFHSFRVRSRGDGGDISPNILPGGRTIHLSPAPPNVNTWAWIFFNGNYHRIWLFHLWKCIIFPASRDFCNFLLLLLLIFSTLIWQNIHKTMQNLLTASDEGMYPLIAQHSSRRPIDHKRLGMNNAIMRSSTNIETEHGF